jgi:TusA-related sulfurtransferase
MIELNLTGLKCPLPVLKTRKALLGLEAGQCVLVICTDPLSAIDIPHLVRQTGNDLVEQSSDDATLRFLIRKAAP